MDLIIYIVPCYYTHLKQVLEARSLINISIAHRKKLAKRECIYIYRVLYSIFYRRNIQRKFEIIRRLPLAAPPLNRN